MIQKNDLEEELGTQDVFASGELDSWMDEEDRLQLELEKLKEFLGEETPAEEQQPRRSAPRTPAQPPILDEELAALLRTEEPQDLPISGEPPQTEAPKKAKKAAKKTEKQASEKKSGRRGPSVGLIVLIFLELAGIGGIAAWWVHWIG